MIPDLRAGSSRHRLKPLSEWYSETKRYWKHEADSAQLSTDSHCHTTTALEKQGCPEFTQAALCNTGAHIATGCSSELWHFSSRTPWSLSFIATQLASRGLKWSFFCILWIIADLSTLKMMERRISYVILECSVKKVRWSQVQTLHFTQYCLQPVF